MDIRPGNYRSGFRSICPRLPTLRAALERLAHDGHLGQRKCLVVHGRNGYSAYVYKGGRTRRIPQGEGVGARVTKGLGPMNPKRAWLEVPADEIPDACAIVADLTHAIAATLARQLERLTVGNCRNQSCRYWATCAGCGWHE